MKKFENPFLHFVVDNFLSEEDHIKIKELHSVIPYEPKETDLYSFFQSKEINGLTDIKFFKDKIENIFGSITDTKDAWYDIFSSFYCEGNYLLCHDDKIDNRVYAFTYYLDDYESGELILYENDATTISKKVEIKANRLVIFKVSDISYHEVGYCETYGRRAITGWINKLDVIKSTSEEDTDGNTNINERIVLTDDIEEFEIDINFKETDAFSFSDVSLDFECDSKCIEGPFYSRRLERLNIKPTMVLKIDGYEVIQANYYNFRVGDYILLNDKTNFISGDICDVFIIETDEELEDDETEAIRYADNEGNISAEFPIKNGNMYVVRRNNTRLFIRRSEVEFKIAHFIYLKTE